MNHFLFTHVSLQEKLVKNIPQIFVFASMKELLNSDVINCVFLNLHINKKKLIWIFFLGQIIFFFVSTFSLMPKSYCISSFALIFILLKKNINHSLSSLQSIFQDPLCSAMDFLFTIVIAVACTIE